jgi:hypothetical protein
VLGGFGNTASAQGARVVGGMNNTAGSLFSRELGGADCVLYSDDGVYPSP